MLRFKQTLVVLLICQFILGPCNLAWGQVQEGRSGGKSVRGKSSGGVGAGRAARGQQGGEAGGGKSGVQAAGTADEILPGGQALSRAVLPDKYVLGPGDSLTVNIWGEFDETYSVKITPDGKISLPTIGDLEIKELTLAQATKLLESQVNRYYRNVRTGVSLNQLRVFQVLVLGEVITPGAYLATPVKRVSDVVAQAGGVLPGGSKRYIQLRRGERVYATADITAFFRQGDESLNPFLHDGDVVFVPPMGVQRVSFFISEIESGGGGGALTEVSTPYLVEMKEGERVSSAITELGGINPWWDMEGIIVQRQYQIPEGTARIPVDLRRYYQEGDESQNVVLQSGDQVYISSSIRRVLVAGAVGKSGSFTYVPGKSADAYVAQAGGASLVADLSRSVIRRADGTMEPYSGSTEINNGDSIIVLEKLFKTWQDYFALVGTATGVILSMVGFYAAFTNFGR